MTAYNKPQNLLIDRLVAYAIDLLITIGIAAMFLWFASQFFVAEDFQKGYFMTLNAFITTIFFTVYVPLKSDGATFGKQIMKIKVVNTNGKPLSVWQLTVREFILKYGFAAGFIPFAIIYSFIMCIARKKLALYYVHDIMLKTDVIKKER